MGIKYNENKEPYYQYEKYRYKDSDTYWGDHCHDIFIGQENNENFYTVAYDMNGGEYIGHLGIEAKSVVKINDRTLLADGVKIMFDDKLYQVEKFKDIKYKKFVHCKETLEWHEEKD